ACTGKGRYENRQECWLRSYVGFLGSEAERYCLPRDGLCIILQLKRSVNGTCIKMHARFSLRFHPYLVRQSRLLANMLAQPFKAVLQGNLCGGTHPISLGIEGLAASQDALQ